ncbi:dihydrofolate reductase [Cryobacterium mesophilum]|uniref:Deaminase n=1 Tax=Terrimesophilobacter mesophilus TaxID=433647 RepID=A0A4R8VA30_9MICO|nr:dihydrofolate reductase family protein [Terrimesophilobacter mesophilus]MBB5631788.1 dihydrofolate reductase [Terrimesophilobacter mesophilus]TFB78707.1 deaminase [Terrimesophilobacter mesophilus]
MARLVYTAICSLDGYIEDAAGSFDWAMPDEEVHRFANDLERSVGLCLYGRRLYETMVFWEDPANLAGGPDFVLEYGELWRANEKVVFSRSLPAVSSERTRLVRDFDPELVRRWKAEADADLSIGGAELAGLALRAGLVDDVHLLIAPILVGGGKRALPEGVTQKLELAEERRFASGFVHLGYRVSADLV